MLTGAIGFSTDVSEIGGDEDAEDEAGHFGRD